MVTYGQIYFETGTPMPRTSSRSPRGGDRHGANHLSLRFLYVELLELTSSIPIWAMGRAAAITSSLFSSGNLGKKYFCTAVLQAISGMAISTVTYGRFVSKRLYAHAARIRPKPSRRPPSSLHPFLAPSPPPTFPVSLGPACPVYGVIGVNFQHPNLGDGSSSGNRLRERSGNALRYFQANLGKIILVLQQLCASNKRHGNTSSLFSSGKLDKIHFYTAVPQAITSLEISMAIYGRFLSERVRPCRTHQVEAPRGGFLSLSIPPLLPPSLPPSLSSSVLGPACAVCCVWSYQS